MGLAAVEITGELLQNMITKGWAVGEESHVQCTEGLPEGAEFRGSYIKQWEGMYVLNTATVVLVFEHSNFGELDEGMVIPFIPVVFREKR